MSDFPNWFEELKQYTRGMKTQVDEFPAVGSPEEELPSSNIHLTDMTDEEISFNYQLVAKWQAYAEYTAGMYAAAEASCKKQLDQIERQVYRELKDQQPGKKFTNAKEAEILVKLDPRYRQAEDRYTAFKQGHEMIKSTAGSYGKEALTYAGERKDRREKESRRFFKGDEYNAL